MGCTIGTLLPCEMRKRECLVDVADSVEVPQNAIETITNSESHFKLMIINKLCTFGIQGDEEYDKVILWCHNKHEDKEIQPKPFESAVHWSLIYFLEENYFVSKYYISNFSFHESTSVPNVNYSIRNTKVTF